MKKVSELSAKRAQFVKDKLAKDKGSKKGFDQKVIEVLRIQAAKKNITYK